MVEEDRRRKKEGLIRVRISGKAIVNHSIDYLSQKAPAIHVILLKPPFKEAKSPIKASNTGVV